MLLFPCPRFGPLIGRAAAGPNQSINQSIGSGPAADRWLRFKACRSLYKGTCSCGLGRCGCRLGFGLEMGLKRSQALLHPTLLTSLAGVCLNLKSVWVFSFCSALCTKQKGFPIGEAAPALPSVINIAHTVTKHPPGKQLTPIILPESHPGGTEQR